MAVRVAQRHTLFLLLAAAFGPHVRAFGATAKDILPPPGLYRVDADTTITRADVPSEIKHHRDGATGTEHEQVTVGGQVGTSAGPGTGQVTQCIKPAQASAVQAQALAAATGCTQQSMKVIGDKTLLHTSQCPNIAMTMEITKLDDKHWRYVTRTEMAAPTGVANVDGLEGALKLQAQYGKTQQERDEAAKYLAALPAQKKELAGQQSAQLAAMKAALAKETDPQARALMEKSIANMSGKSAPFAPGAAGNSVTVGKAQWTRIADTCGGK